MEISKETRDALLKDVSLDELKAELKARETSTLKCKINALGKLEEINLTRLNVVCKSPNAVVFEHNGSLLPCTQFSKRSLAQAIKRLQQIHVLMR